MRQRVTIARARQARRYAGCHWRLNGGVPGPVLTERWPLDATARAVLEEEMGSGRLTRRGGTRVRRLAWTVADGAGLDRPGVQEVRTALILRSTDASRSLPGDVLRSVS